MASRDFGRRLIVNADDFGRSSSINHAVIRAHQDGILTSASLMVTGDAVEEAVQLARENPQLGVGLHLTLVCGRSVLPHKEIPGLVNRVGEFSDNAVAAGMKYFFSKALVSQLTHEIGAQFRVFHSYGIPLDHVNGHLNIHMHPTILRILCDNARDWEIKQFRVTRDLFWLNAKLDQGRWLYKMSHALIYLLLSWRTRGALSSLGIRHTDFVFGLLQNAHVDEAYLLRLLDVLPEGNSELYSHPSLNEFKPEFEALISPRVLKAVRERQVELIRYQDL